MIREHNVDVVLITTPHPLHADQTITAAQAGAHSLIEKPMAITTADCDRMIAAAREHHVKLGVISQRRLYAPVQRMHEAIKAGKVGSPILGSVTLLGWRSEDYYKMDPWRGTWDGEGGGVMVNQAVHQLDLFQWLMGPIAEVFGYWGNFNHPSVEVEDTAVGVVRFRSGALGTLMVSNSQNPGLYGHILVHGANGASLGVQTESGSTFISGVTTQVEPPFNTLWTVPDEMNLLAGWQAEDRALSDSIDFLTYYHVRQIEDFLNAVIEDREPLVSGEEGRKGVALFEAIYESQRTGQPIKFSEEHE
jgi:predicted dehydrogenase